MTSQLFFAYAVTAFLIVSSGFITRRLLASIMQASKDSEPLPVLASPPKPTFLGAKLREALPDSVILPHDAAAFRQSMNSYWAQQECERVPACIAQPRNTEELCKAVTIIKQYFEQAGSQPGGLFAIRSGGHCPVHNAASMENGVVIDLSLICEVTPSLDHSSVTIGTGAKWMDVSKVLDEKGLAVVGGRSSAVGVGGLILGARVGGISFFSPRFGLVCSNVLSYELVLASGSITTASASNNPDLYRALKGGSNNFGIVTRFTVRSLPISSIWSGFLYMPAFQAKKAIAAFYESVNRLNSDSPDNEHVAGPIACFSYIQLLRIQMVAVNLIHTNPSNTEREWPAFWKSSSFRSFWRLWSTCKVRTLTSATDETSNLNPPGRRQVFATTTIKNDAKTLIAAHAAYSDTIASLGRVKGLVWTLVLQPLLPKWARKGDSNPLGLGEGTSEPLIVVNFTVNWLDRKDDEFVNSATRRTVEQIDVNATANKTGHRFRYLNYCAEWQRPFEGYGEDNLLFLQKVSRRYDPEGLFQKGCAGGFKLGVMKEEP